VAEAPEAFPRGALEGSLGARFEAVARAHPGRLAIQDRGRSLTYAELDARANRLGHRVLAERGEGSEPVVILARQDAGAIVAMLAMAKAGKIFAPLDPHLPPSRLAAIVAESGAPLILAGAEDLALAREIAGTGAAAAVLDRDDVDPAGPAAAPAVAVAPGTPLSLFYTSGSTGAPKGVLGSHRLILHRAWAYALTAHLTPSDRLSVLHALSGGGSLRNLWGGLLSGGAVLPYDVARDGLVGLGAWLDREAITICHCAASVFRHFGAALTAADGLAALRLL
jgi:non-ribosomal peptide synthetase component F